MNKFLDYVSEKYYAGEPVITDHEFDTLASLHNYNSVGSSTTGGTPHLYQMYSLQKFFDIKEAPPWSKAGTATSIKLDGAAVSLLYSGGALVLALTRGDGKKGQNVTSKVAKLVPNTVEEKRTFQVTGEVVAPSDIPNSRNYASGALNLKSDQEFSSRKLFFYAYDVNDPWEATWAEQMRALSSLGFNTVYTDKTNQFPDDGIVYRLNNYAEFYKLGYTAHHPRGAFALKEQKVGVCSKLLDVVWQVGKSGVVSPVAILEPVLVGDATVSRATLHNIQYIEELGLEIGCSVEIIRAGEIIPRVVRRIK